jgi:hypothetical protein
MTEAEETAGGDELREVAGGRADLLAQEAGLALGTSEDRGTEYRARGQAVAKLCRMAGASEELVPQWIAEGKRRAEAGRKPPFSESARRR